MSRDGLVIFQSRDGRITEATERWRTLAAAYITERGRKLVGMPLIAPPFAARLPVGSRAVWVREGKPDMPVEVKSWQFSNGAVGDVRGAAGP
ncbi:hypothetical protein [Streptomyces flaveus]|uniref:hypothetical protein n=1 Tax=Streptomyces flaveus TaxID=66370 RepID=UPI00331AB409